VCGPGDAPELSDGRPAAKDGTYGTNATYMSDWSYKSYSSDVPGPPFRGQLARRRKALTQFHCVRNRPSDDT
jgi:hypothetical protein